MEVFLGGCVAVLVLALIWMGFQAIEWRNNYHYWKRCYKKQNGAFVAKEKKITELKGMVARLQGENRALAWATNLLQDLEAMDDLMEEMEREAVEKTPEWYRCALLSKLGEVKNMSELLKLSEESNTLLVGKFEELQKEYDAIAGKINKLAEQYKEFRDEKPETMLSGLTGAEQASPADDGQLVVGGC